MYWFIVNSYINIRPKTLKEWIGFIAYFPIAFIKFMNPK